MWVCRALLVCFSIGLLCPSVGSAATITDADFVCVTQDWEAGHNCEELIGPYGFVVKGTNTWGDAADVPSHSLTEDADWDIVTYDDMPWHTGLLFQRNRPFTLTELSMRFGQDDEFSYGCSFPLELRSSKGGYVVLQPPAATADQTCVTNDVHNPEPWPWGKDGKVFTFTGAEWTNVEWVWLEMPSDVYGNNPYYGIVRVNDLQFAPEPGLALLILTGTGAVLGRSSRRKRITRD